MPAHYTDDYIEQAFYVWYDSNKCGSHKLVNLLPKTEDGNSPARMVIERWIHEKGWIERADALDAEISRKLDDEVINKRMEMYKEHAEVGEMLIAKGKKYLEENGITQAPDAIRAITSGVDIRVASVGKAEAWQKISTMTNEQLDKELYRLTGKTQKKENEFDIEVEAEDIIEDADTVSDIPE
jgi:hypothetical protein